MSNDIKNKKELFHKYRKSFCGRNVIKTVYPEAIEYYRSLGYRWYHVIPDNTFTRNSPMFRLSFWRNIIKP